MNSAASPPLSGWWARISARRRRRRSSSVSLCAGIRVTLFTNDPSRSGRRPRARRPGDPDVRRQRAAHLCLQRSARRNRRRARPTRARGGPRPGHRPPGVQEGTWPPPESRPRAARPPQDTPSSPPRSRRHRHVANAGMLPEPVTGPEIPGHPPGHRRAGGCRSRRHSLPSPPGRSSPPPPRSRCALLRG